MSVEPRPNLTLKTVGMILEHVRSGGLDDGDALPPEKDFAPLLGVSRVVLREALSYLKGLGLVRSRRGSGFRVARVRFSDVLRQALEHISIPRFQNLAELYELRRIFETGAVAGAVAAAAPADIEAINAALEKLGRLLDSPDFDDSVYLRAELEFHQAIMRPGKCAALDVINSAVARFFETRIDSPSPKKIKLSRDTLRKEHLEHKMIALAFALGWPDAAELCLKKHLGKSASFNSPPEKKF
jgi:GntR family transcriptional repressor for pyruvate dehydrogenase complex